MLWSYPNPEWQGGFIDSASGAFTKDPQSNMVLDSKGLYRTPSEPFLYGNYGGSAFASTSYLPSQKRWLPVPPQFVSPDGKTYAYGIAANSPGGGVHFVEVASGTDRVVESTIGIPNANFFPVGYLPDGIYLIQFGPTGGGSVGVWHLNPTANAITQVSTDAPAIGTFVGQTPLISPRSNGNPDAWWTDLSIDFSAPSDPAVYHQYLTGVPGQHGEVWFRRPGFHMSVIGVNNDGQAIAMAQSSNRNEVWLLATPNSARLLYSTDGPGSREPAFKTAVADRTGWWIGGKTGVYFATTTEFTRVSTTPSVVVGGCG
jgi:hypothetical protein